MSIVVENSNRMLLHVAGLRLELDAQGTGLKILSPHCYEEFQKPVAQPQAFLVLKESKETIHSHEDRLLVKIKNHPLDTIPELIDSPAVFQYDNWEIKFDNQDNFILEALRLHPSRRLVVNPDFTVGQLQGDFSEVGEAGSYPMKDMDMKLFVNWLARSGDLILHASGVVVSGKGVAFAGKAGAGKSTLASFLLQNHELIVLGEDQVVLRYIDGRFWIFGTPWHENPEMCSPMGAPLEKLFFLDREMPNGVSAVKAVECTTRILQTAFVPFYRQDLLPGIMDRLEILATQVPAFTLSYPLGSDPWPLIDSA